MNKVYYKEIDVSKLEEYDKIPFCYETNKKYELIKLDNGLGGILFKLVDIPLFKKDFGSRTSRWTKMFDLSNWKFYAAFNQRDEMIGGCSIATRTKNCDMLEGRNDLVVLWDIRVDNNYRHQGIGQKLFDMAINYAKSNGFKQLKVECQNTNVAAVNFYHKQGMKLCAINEYAYSDSLDEVQMLWYLDL